MLSNIFGFDFGCRPMVIMKNLVKFLGSKDRVVNIIYFNNKRVSDLCITYSIFMKNVSPINS